MMDKELYEEILSDISVQFGAGDIVEPEDRKFCAKQIVEHLQQLGYRKADEVRKETAKEILQKMYNLCMSNSPFSPSAGCLSKQEILEFARVYGVEVD